MARQRDNRRWSAAEDAILIAFFGLVPLEEIASKLHRTLASTNARAVRLRAVGALKVYAHTPQTLRIGVEEDRLGLKVRSKEAAEIVRQARQQGWELDGINGSGHITMTHPEHGVYRFSGNVSDTRGVKNIRADFRRRGVIFPGDRVKENGEVEEPEQEVLIDEHDFRIEEVWETPQEEPQGRLCATCGAPAREGSIPLYCDEHMPATPVGEDEHEDDAVGAAIATLEAMVYEVAEEVKQLRKQLTNVEAHRDLEARVATLEEQAKHSLHEDSFRDFDRRVTALERQLAKVDPLARFRQALGKEEGS